MLEVPALSFQLPVLLKRVDFISVGSNDLFQFLLQAIVAALTSQTDMTSLAPAALFFLRHLG